MKHTMFTLLFIICASVLHGSERNATGKAMADGSNGQKKPVISKERFKNPFLFMENKGQITDQDYSPRKDIQFRISGGQGLNIFIGNGAIHFQFSKAVSDAGLATPWEALNSADLKAALPNPVDISMYRMDVELVGANKNAKVQTNDKQGFCESYALPGNRFTAKGYSKITYKDVYPHIDWVLYTSNGKLKHEFIVRNGGKVSDIKLKYGGASDLKLSKEGSLKAFTPFGSVTEQAPVSYQADGKPVSSAFVLNGDVLSYNTGTYSGALTIDPTLEWATYFGDVSTDATFQMAKDRNSNLIAVGVSYSSANIATAGAYQTTYSGSSDGIIVKYNSDGQLQWCTYFATTQYDGVYNVAIDASNNIYVTGGAGAVGLATSGAQQTTYGGGLYDMFLAKFTPSGGLTWCTYLGGSGADIGAAVALDGSGNIYLAGYSSSSSGIASGSAHQTTYGGGVSTGDGVLAKYNSSGVKQWCTYYGGSSDDQVVGMDLGSSGDIYIAGPTASTSGIASAGAFQTSFGGLNDGFFAKFNSSGTRIWGSYIGGPNADRANNICVDASDNVYVVGSFASDGFATTGVHQGARAGSTDAFISRWTSGGAQTWFTYYGGTFQDVANGVYADNSGVYVTGQVSGTAAGITTADAYQSGSAGGNDAFIARFDKNAGSIIYGSYYGGTGTDMGYRVIPDGGDLYFTGYTFSPGMATPGAAKVTYTGGQQKGWVAKFNFCTPPMVNVTGAATICSGSSTPLTASGTATTYTWSPSTGLSATTGASVTANPTATTTYTLTGTAGCSATALVTVSVNPVPVVNQVSNVTKCAKTLLSAINFSSSTPSTTYTWTNSIGSIGLATTGTGSISSFSVTNTATAPKDAIITVTPSANGCTGSVMTFTITVNPVPTNTTLLLNLTRCNGEVTAPINFVASVPGSVYTWTNSNAAVGIGTTGTGNLPPFTAVNTGTSDITGTFYAFPEFTNNGVTCSSAGAYWTLTVKPGQTPVAINTGSSASCAGDPITLTGSNSASYTWSPSAGLSATTGAGVVATPTVTTTYTVTGTTNTCTSKAISTITIKQPPVLTMGQNPQACYSSSSSTSAFTYTVTSAGTGSSTSGDLIWDLAAHNAGFTDITTFSLTGSTTFTIPGATPGAIYSGELHVRGDGCVRIYPVKVTVHDEINITTTPTSQSVCNGSAANPISFSSTGAGITYTWANSNSSIGLATTGTGNIASFTAANSTSATVTATVAVTPSAGGCTGTPQDFTITVKPTPVINSITNQVVCNSATTAPINFNSSIGSATYTWVNSNNSMGLATTGTGNIAAFTAANAGATASVSTVTATPVANGCAGTPGNFTITVNPTPTVNTISNQSLCNNVTTTAVNFSGTVSPATYTWTNSNSSTGLATAGTGNIGAFTAVNTGTSIVTTTVTVTPSANSCTGSSKVFTIAVNPTPSVGTTAGQVVCNGAATTAVTFTGTVSSTTYTWGNSNSSIGLASTGSGNIGVFTAGNSTSGIVTSTITVTPRANGCNGTNGSFTIRVNPTPTVAMPADQSLCNGATTAPAAFTGLVSSTSYTWTNSNSSIGLANTGTGNIAAFTAINSGSSIVTATITVTPAANGCTGSNGVLTITVKPMPDVVSPGNQTVCNGLTTTAVNYSGTVSGTNYSWTNSNGSIGLATTGTGNIAAFTATNSGSATETASVTVVPSANGCTGASEHFTITIHPTPSVASPSNQVLCNGATTAAVNFTGPVSGTAFSWSNTDNAIGLATSGTGNIAAFTAVNTSSAIITASVTVTPSANGCSGSATTFTVRVNPTPDVATPADQVLCDGAATLPVNYTGTVTGTTYTWSNSSSSIGLATTGAGNIASFSAVNSGTSIKTATLSVLPSANGCSGTSQTFLITVNPIPSVTPLTNQTLCNGAATTLVSFTGAVSGTDYNWTNSNSSIGLATTGTGNIISFTTVNSGSAPTTATIEITPVANGCSGTAESFTIVVNPTPSVEAPANQVLCNNAKTASVNYSGPVAGTAYSWVNNTTSIGLAANGTGNIGAFSANNSGVLPVTATITVTPEANGCTGSAKTFTIKVNPTPGVTASANQVLCSGASTQAVTFIGSVTGSTFAWTNSNSSIGLNATGTGNISSFTAVTGATALSTATITVTPAANSCIGMAQSFVITVNPNPAQPAIDTKPAGSLCGNTLFQNFGTAATAPAGAQYSWSVSNAVLWNEGAGKQYCLVSFPNAGESIVTLTASHTTSGCATKVAYTVQVGSNSSSAPEVIYHNGHFICLQHDVDSYVWGYDNALSLDSAIITGENTQNYFIDNPDLTNKYYWVMTTKDGCTRKSYYKIPSVNIGGPVQEEFAMTVYPNPAINIVNIELRGAEHEQAEIRIFDMTGRKVATLPLADYRATVDINQFAPGMYVVACYEYGARTASATFVKQ